MANRSKDQEIPTVTLDDIVQLLRNELGPEIDISPDSHGELLTEIGIFFERYRGIKDLKDVRFDLFEDVAEYDDAISAVKKVRPRYIELEKQKAGRERIDLFLGNLRRGRDRLLEEAKKNPFTKMGLKSPKGWLTWRLVICLRRAFPDRSVVYDYEIHDAIISLLQLFGVEAVESEGSEKSRRRIRARFKEYSKKINPHLPPDHISVYLSKRRGN